MFFLDELGDWLDQHMSETWPAYAFMAFLVLLGCYCGGLLVSTFVAVFG